jgi:cyclopropane fatty-acyl-phospholipid synthase-like methyltransferase
LEVTSAEQVRRYFDAEAERFDTIYRSDKGLGQRLVDGLFRTVIHRRYALTLELCGDVQGRRVLDVGCGSGRYCLELARRGAEVVGLDFAPAMVAMARQRAAELGVAERCTFEVTDFLAWCEPHHFDICLGIGFFDYVDEPERFLVRMREMTRGQGVFSFPVRWTARSLSRRLRLTINRCPVHFYGARQVAELLRRSGWVGADVHRLSRDYLAHAQATTDPVLANEVGVGG